MRFGAGQSRVSWQGYIRQCAPSTTGVTARVVGYLLLISMGRQGFIGQWLFNWFGISFSFSWRGAPLAAAI